MARILLAEDDPGLRRVLVRALDAAGHSVRAAGDGLEALRQLHEEAVDLLLADIVMPGLDGMELARRAGGLHPGLRIMFITGFAAVVLRDGRMEQAPAGARLLSKPFHLRDLVREVDALLEVA
ncbi:response regulator [Fodinicurvata halophila]|uniref:Response regulator n=1 Tax=Fodinicurvata halophila TaxID=1419723 RepID=A0ABV8UGC8_9PROT